MPEPTTVQATLSCGSTDFSPFVAYDGIEQRYADRIAADVITLDGTLTRAGVRKRVMTVALREMWHEDLATLFAGVAALAQWSYLDETAGPSTKQFYRTGPTVRQTLARGGKTLCTGISFTLEEK